MNLLLYLFWISFSDCLLSHLSSKSQNQEKIDLHSRLEIVDYRLIYKLQDGLPLYFHMYLYHWYIQD